MEVYACGRGEDGQLGVGDTTDRFEPKLLTHLEGKDVVQIGCGSGHTVALVREGKVYTWGRGDDGRLAHGDSGWQYVPRLVVALSNRRITRVACGSYHTAAISEDGELFTFGGGMYGKLGHGSECGHSLPCRVESLVGRFVTQVACGSRHTVALTREDSEVFAWGDSENGVSGIGDNDGQQYTPRLVEQLCGQNTVQISACGFHSAAVTLAGRVFSWGDSKFGRLGYDSVLNVAKPQLIDALRDVDIEYVACGGFHTAAITKTGEMYTWGGGEHGQLGHGDKVNRTTPTLVKALGGVRVSQITCGWSHTVALGEGGTVFTWGNGDHGKLGHNDVAKVTVPRKVEALSNKRVTMIASYNEHTAVLVSAETETVVESSSLIDDFDVLVDQDSFSDVTFVVESRPIYAHRAILAARSQHFRAMFSSGMRESNSDTITIANTRYDIFLALLRYIYTDRVDLSAEDAAELYMTAEMYALDRLKDLCQVQVMAQLSKENAPTILGVADSMSSLHLRTLCIKFIVRNFDDVSKVDAFNELSRDLILEVLRSR